MSNIGKKQELTSRQKEVLSLLRKGLTNNEICRTLNISPNTVKVHLAKIYKIMEVTNRTEAAFAESESAEKDVNAFSEVKIAFVKSGISLSSKTENLYYSLITCLHRYQIFNIRECPAEEDLQNENFTYQVKFTVMDMNSSAIRIVLLSGDSSRILWSYLKKIENGVDVSFLAEQITLQFFHQLVVISSKEFLENANAQPRWWYACCYSNVEMECRNREFFERCEKLLVDFVENPAHNTYTAYVLAVIYYSAVTESWVDASVYTKKLGKMAAYAMRYDPYSMYSQFIMAMYKVLVGDKDDAIAYFLQIIDANPLDVVARRVLAQIYLLVGKEKKALKLLNENELYVPESMSHPSQLEAKSLVYFMLGEYKKCIKTSEQLLFLYPESPCPRLYAAASCELIGDSKKREKHRAELFKYHPNFQITDVENLIKGVSPGKKEVLMTLAMSIFGK